MRTQRASKSKYHDNDDIPSAELSVSQPNYRRAISNPMIKLANIKQEDYEMKLTRSFPAETIHRSQNIKKSQTIDSRLPKLLLEALSLPPKFGLEHHSSSQQSRTLSKIHTTSGTQVIKESRRKSKKKVRKCTSLETPSIILSETSSQDVIKPIDEFPLYKVINDAVGDLAGLMSSNVLKKTHKQQEPQHQLREARTESSMENTSLILSQETDVMISQGNLGKGVNLYLKPIPPDLSNYLKSKCSLWRLQSKKRPSVQSSMSVNPSSEVPEESHQENRIVNEEDEANDHYQPNNQSKIIKTLIEECNPRNTIYRNIRKGTFPYRINPKDYPDLHRADVNNSKHFLQSLTGHDKVILNMRPTMVKIHRFLVKRHLLEVESRQRYLEENETKRLRKLQIQGIVNVNYDETESATDNNKLSEKPHITYNSVRPIFNENPFANTYKCMVKQFNRDLNMKEKELEDVASIGEVSFISSSSSYEKNLLDDMPTTLKERRSNFSFESQGSLIQPDNQSCIRYMAFINQHLDDMDKESHMATIYEASEPLMINIHKLPENKKTSSKVNKLSQKII